MHPSLISEQVVESDESKVAALLAVQRCGQTRAPVLGTPASKGGRTANDSASLGRLPNYLCRRDVLAWNQAGDSGTGRAGIRHVCCRSLAAITRPRPDVR